MLDLINFVRFECAIEANDEYIHIWDDRNSRGGRAREEVLPRHIEVSEKLVENLARYAGDGKTMPGSHHIEYSSIDDDLVRKHIHELESIFGVQRNLQRFYLRSPQEENILGYAQKLQVNKSCITTYVKNRHRNTSITAQYGSKYFATLYISLTNWLINTKLLSKELQASFLKGLFAAEGCVHQQNGNCISGLSFSLHSNEILIQQQLERCLSSLGIDFSTRIMKNRKCKITTITGWKNYAACWSLGILDGCSRKKQSFYEQLIDTDLHAEVTDAFKTAIYQFWDSVHELSKYTSVSYDRLLYWFDNTTKLTIQELVSLATASDYLSDVVRDHIIALHARLSDEIVAEGFLDSYWNALRAEGILP